MSTTTHYAEQKCPACGYKQDSATSAYGDHKPKGGDLSICLNCGAIAMFNDDLTLRPPNEKEKRDIAANTQVIQAQLIRAGIVDRDLRKGR